MLALRFAYFPIFSTPWCVQDQKKGIFQAKRSKIVVKQKAGSGYKTVGFVELNLADYVNNAERSTVMNERLQKCSDKKAFLKFTLHSRLLAQLSDSSVRISKALLPTYSLAPLTVTAPLRRTTR